MKNRAKELIADGKEKEAKKILQEATRLKKQLQVYMILIRVLKTGRRFFNSKNSMLKHIKPMSKLLAFLMKQMNLQNKIMLKDLKSMSFKENKSR